MSNTTATTNDCTRCGGEALPQYQHVAGGKCFKCGRTLRGTGAPAFVRTAPDRATIIARLAILLRKAETAAAEGWLPEFMAGVTSEENGLILPGMLHIAPADVRARAEAAFAKLAA